MHEKRFYALPHALNDSEKEDFILGFFKTAKKTFLRDGYYGLILILFKDMEFVDAIGVEADDRHERIEELATSMSDRPFDTVIMMSEQWSAPLEIVELGLMPSESDRRIETLGVWGAFCDGAMIEVSAEILRDGDALDLAPRRVSRDMKFHLLEPIVEKWQSLQSH